MELTRRDGIAISLVLAAMLALGIGGWLVATSIAASPDAGLESLAPSPDPLATSGSTSPAPTTSAGLVVDVQGAVRHPGVVALPAGARVADALRAAGGYSGRADLNAAASALNLAALLADGSQVYVPMIGMAAAGGPVASQDPGAAGGGLVNVNTATPEALEALPGIGPVTVQKIVAGRAQQPFTSLDEMVQREVIDRGQLEDIRDLVTF